ncbi:MAG: serine/threonine protein kinase, partial [Deltaproteobacteria bacterium]|nr:serine/threonine protein kinase [Deltaproteobacteria bacterium]
RAVHILLQACDSLAEAHDAQLVHRDIKPANIMVARHGRAFDFVKVLDFGLVALKPEWEKQGDARLTREGSVGGTPAYMAPEVSRGRTVDGRTDIYALGCVAFWLLTGNRVFSGETPLAVMVAHASDVPRRASEVAEGDIPEALDALVLECLAKDPGDRPASADDLARRLEGIAGGSRWTQERAGVWWRQHRPATAADRVQPQ